ncbi:MAG: hypothetical protein WC906_05265 [Parcubacteria group bacterium]|jgi:hypothetical protein
MRILKSSKEIEELIAKGEKWGAKDARVFGRYLNLTKESDGRIVFGKIDGYDYYLVFS